MAWSAATGGHPSDEELLTVLAAPVSMPKGGPVVNLICRRRKGSSATISLAHKP